MLVSLRRSTAVIALCSGLLVSPFVGIAMADPDGGYSSAAQVADAPRLASVDNFRDVAGTGAGYQAGEEHHLRKGVFYRSNALTPNDADLATLNSLRLTTVYDLRSTAEIAAKPDRLPTGAKYINIPILSGDPVSAAKGLKSPDEAKAFMRTMNQSFVTGATEQAGFKQLLTDLADGQGPVDIHCTAGKDRTGWASYLLQTIAGVEPDTIMSDYLLTNQYSAKSIAGTLAQITAAYGAAVAAIYAPLLGVDATYLQAGIDQIKTSYGSFDKYLTDGLGLDRETIEKLKHKLVGHDESDGDGHDHGDSH